ADADAQSTALAQQFRAIAYANDRTVDATEHAQHAVEPRNVRLPALTLAGFPHGTTNRGRQARQITLQYVVHDAPMQRIDGALLAHLSRNEYEWDLRRELACHGERPIAVEPWQIEIRQDDRRFERQQRPPQSR